MEYINKKTGFSIETESLMAGSWVLKSEYKPDVQDESETLEKNSDQGEEIQESAEPETTGDEKYDSVTKAQIMQELDAFGVEYDNKATKRALYDLMTTQGE